VISNPPKLSEAVDALLKLHEQGKTKHIGVSNFGDARLTEILGFTNNIVANELPYSLLTRAIEWEMLGSCLQKDVGVIGYMVFLQGLLADVYPTLSDVPDWQRRTRHFSHRRSPLSRHGEEGAEEQTKQALADIRNVAQQCNLSMPEIAVKWILAQKGITCAPVGARNMKEVKANVKAACEPLPDVVVDKLNRITEPLRHKLGPSFDYYEAAAKDRT
jgi:aryl-alcohol dehydrogenase-like predicted oxidoreductase